MTEKMTTSTEVAIERWKLGNKTGEPFATLIFTLMMCLFSPSSVGWQSLTDRKHQ